MEHEIVKLFNTNNTDLIWHDLINSVAILNQSTKTNALT